jgi:lysophospholipase L1-like esterase
MAWLAFALLMPQLFLPVAPDTSAPSTTIVFFGDSLTQGLHASRPELTYRGLMTERLLHTRDNGNAVAVIQHPMGLLDDAQRRLPLVLASRPSLVFLELGHHEVWSDDAQMELFEARYVDILDRLLASGADVVPSTLAWLGWPPESPEYAKAMRANTIIRRLARERDLVVADLWTRTDRRPELISRPSDFSFLEPGAGDDLHPNDAGHRVLADAFWRAYRTLRTRPPLGLLTAV